MSFAGLTDRTAAEALRGTMLVVDVDEAERFDDPDEFYDHHLIGLRARTPDATEVGVVADVLHLPAQDVLAIKRLDGVEILVPFVAELVPAVDLDAGTSRSSRGRGCSTPTSTSRADPMRVDVITIFPDYLSPLTLSLVGKARERGLLDVRVHDLRDFTHDAHRTVDDTPYGGGAGMVMRPEPWGEALDAIIDDADDDQLPLLIVPTPAGVPFTQARAEEYAHSPWLAFACGRYEGIDYRVVDDARRRMRVDELSIGDYVLGGGEAAALVVLEAVVRLLPGVVGNAESLVDESHVAGLLEGPAYTKPPSWRGLDVPEVLTSGHHGDIARWRRAEALRRTAQRRPDLLAASPRRPRHRMPVGRADRGGDCRDDSVERGRCGRIERLSVGWIAIAGVIRGPGGLAHL